VNIKGIISYPHLFTPRAVQAGDEPKYSCNILIPKNDPQVAQIVAEIEKAKQAGFPTGFPHNAKVCLRDCAADPTNPPMLANYLELRCSSKDKPATVTLPDLKPIIDPALVYGGAEAYFAVNIASYSLQMSKGVAAYINGVAVTGQIGALGRLDNRPTVEQMFAGIGATATPPLPGGAMFSAPPVMAPPVHIMTPKANGATRDQLVAAGWTDDLLIQHGMMLPPGGAPLPWQP
jgi:hypothetical protein